MEEGALRRRKAVVVDDDPVQLRLLAGLLRRLEVEPRTFSGAEEALRGLDPQDPPDLLVTDLHMPGLDGWRFCRLLRSREYGPFNRVPLLVVSATFGGSEPPRIAEDLGAEGFLSAPVDAQAFADLVEGILRGGKVESPPRVLLLAEEGPVRDLEEAFRRGGYRVIRGLGSEASELLARGGAEVAVLEEERDEDPKGSVLDRFLRGRPDGACVVVLGSPDPVRALDWMKRGAAALVHRPWDPAEVVSLCARARRERGLLRTEDLLERRTRQLRESEERYKRITRAITDYVVTVRLEEGEVRSTAHGPGCHAVTGYREEDFDRDPHLWIRMVPPEDRDRVVDHARACVRGEDAGPLEHRILRQDGDLRWVRHTPVFHRDPQGVLQGYDGLIQDITERRRAEESLRRRTEELKTLVDALPALVVRARDPQCRVVVGNRMLNDLFRIPEGTNVSQWAASEGQGFSIRHLWPDGTPILPEDLPLQQAVAQGREIKDREFLYVLPDGRRLPVLGNAVPLFDESGGVRGAVGVFWDMTEHKRAEEERERLREQLVQAQKMESVGRLAGGVAHDFNNMLGVILGRADLALEEAAPGSSLAEDLREIRHAAERSADLTRQLLAFARRQTVVPRVVDLNATVEGMLKMLRRLLGEDMELLWVPGPDLGFLRMDPSQIDQVLANLCVNARDALDAAGGRGRVVIETASVLLEEGADAVREGCTPGDYVRLTVRDNGCGMSPEALGRLFEPFYTTKEVGKGTGLGLATIYGIVKQNRGHVEVESEPGAGTVFRIFLPRVPGETPPAELPGEPGPGGGGETLLLVEDESAILRMTARMLRNLGYRVLEAATPGEALDLARQEERIHLLLTDVVMPEMNGRDLARALEGRHGGMKCLFTSGYTADVLAPHGVLEEGTRFLPKPFTQRELAARIREILEGEG